MTQLSGGGTPTTLNPSAYVGTQGMLTVVDGNPTTFMKMDIDDHQPLSGDRVPAQDDAAYSTTDAVRTKTF